MPDRLRDCERKPGPGFAFAVISRTQSLERSRSCALVKLSKIVDYLIDNLCVIILSRLKE